MSAPAPDPTGTDITVATLSPVAPPTEAPAEVKAATASVPQPVLARPASYRSGILVLAIVGFIIVGVALLIVAVYFLAVLGPGLTFLGGILALIPLAIVFLGIRWIDRWEPEPRGALIFAFLWGAGVAVVVALTVDLAVQLVALNGGNPNDVQSLLQTVIQAPIVEESAKGFGVLLIFLVARRSFDGPVDGIVYAATVAGGFAFAENIQYFGLQIATEGGLDGSVGEIFFIRGILSPFAHVMFTSMTGLFIGLAVAYRSRWMGVLFFVIGLVPAILLHMFWNGALYFVTSFYLYYLAVQVPLFVLAVVMVAMLRRREIRMTRTRLSEYATAGWFNASEVESLATPNGRRQAMAWARSHGLRKVMSNYIRDATHLATARQRIITGRDRIGAQLDEAALLAQVTESRRVLAACLPSPAASPTV